MRAFKVAGRRLRPGVEPELEEIHQGRGQLRIAAQGTLHVGQAEGQLDLQQIAGQAAQQDAAAQIQPGERDQLIEAVIVYPPAGHREQGFAELPLHLRALRQLRAPGLQAQFNDPATALLPAGRANHLDPQVFDHRQQPGQAQQRPVPRYRQ